MDVCSVIATRQSLLDDSSDDSCVSRTLAGDGSCAWAIFAAAVLGQLAHPIADFALCCFLC